LIGALRFGHLPAILVPAGPMPSGLPNRDKQRIRQLYAEGKAGREELLEAEASSYHAAGTCTFYGTANSNQMMMEVMGLHVPGAAFVNPGTKLRQELTRAAIRRLVQISWHGNDYRPLGRIVDEKAIVNAAVGLLATGGSTNQVIHLPAIARAAGIIIDWDDFDMLSARVPLIARIYPNGSGDVNQFHAAGGMAFAISTLLDAGLLHRDVVTVGGESLGDYARAPKLDGEILVWEAAPAASRDETMLRPASNPFNPQWSAPVRGNLGRGVFKTSAVDLRDGRSRRQQEFSRIRIRSSLHSKPASSIVTSPSWFASRSASKRHAGTA
jgi:phosphogluconate dehydratase